MPASDTMTKGMGQGRRLIEKGLPYQFKARTRYVVGQDGIRCSIALPVSTHALAESDVAP
jgi:two-component system CheB/CheR fusion protein